MPTSSTLAHQEKSHTGFTLIEVLVTAALVALVFGGLFAAVQAMITLIGESKAKAGAIALATERLEYIRSLSYDAVGTVGAPPFGTLPETQTVTLNDVTYFERLTIRYEDDPADGSGGADSNGIVTDYKKVQVQYSWAGHNSTSSIAVSTNVVPPGIETDVGGGTLRVYVNDANVLPVPFAEVTVTNTSLATTTNTTQLANVNGEFILSGLPVGGGYNISVTLPGYSTDGTATPTPPLSSPAQPVVSIATSSVTTQYFQIDELSSLAIRTNGQPTYGTFTDAFTSAALVASTSATVISGGEVVLAGSPGSYAAAGTVLATTTIPTSLDSWYDIDFTATTSALTSVAVALYYPMGTSTVLVPDSDLPGNSLGFTTSPIDISGLDVSTYPELILGATLRTADTNVTPALEEWTLTYIVSQPTLSAVPIMVTGAKILGDDTTGAPVYKNVFTDVTDGSGVLDFNDIEYDFYTVTVDDPALDVVEVCPSAVVTLNPGTIESVDFTITNVIGPRLHVVVTGVTGDPIPGADVRLEQGSYDVTQSTGLCGQTFFAGGLSVGTSTVTVSRTGYTTAVVTDVAVNATATATVIIN
jgi:prepilin-type N-terminal cleavage/methylation domain-containing protein